MRAGIRTTCIAAVATLACGLALSAPAGAVTLGSVPSASGGLCNTGLVFAQNTMYRHTMTVYDETGALKKTIPDGVDLAQFGYPGHAGISRGVRLLGFAASGQPGTLARPRSSMDLAEASETASSGCRR